jgi:gliding motility-associated-like protein
MEQSPHNTTEVLIVGASTNEGSFKSNDDPVKVFVGGAILPTSLTNNKPDYSALNCYSPHTEEYPHSDCSHGDMTDIIDDPIYPFFLSTCATATLKSSDANNSFCAGTSVTFTAGGGTNYNFRVNGTSVQNGGSTTYTTTTLTNGAVVSVIVTSSGGCSVTSSGITHTVFALPLAEATSIVTVCAGTPLTLTGSPAGMASYTWTGPDGFTANTQNPVVSSEATVVMTGDYSLAVTNANGCTSPSATTSVVVHALPVATPTSNGPVCAGSLLTLTGGPAGMASYSWTGPNGFTANTQSPTVSLTSTVAMAGSYSLIVTNPSGCTSAASTTSVVVYALPVATPTSNGPVCAGSALTLTGGPADMASYSWTGPNGFAANTQNPVVSSEATVVMTGDYSLAVTNADGCTSPAATTSVVVHGLPVATPTSNGPVCVGSALTLTGGPAGMASYSWTGPDGFTANTQNPVVSSEATVVMTGDYSLTVTNANGCTSPSATTDVVVHGLPVATPTSNGPVCAGSPLTLAGGPAGMTSYSWTGPNGLMANTQNPVITPSATVPMSGSYILTVTNANGCTSPATTTAVEVHALPVATATSNGPVCAGSLLTLTGGPAGMTTYSWIGPDGFTATTQNPVVSSEATVVMEGDYSLTITNASGCYGAMTHSALVNEKPIAIPGLDQELTFVFETVMQAEIHSTESGEWSLFSGSGRIWDKNSPTTLVTELKPGENKFLWKVRNSSCEASAEVGIAVKDLLAPSVITPNGDGKNDYFKLDDNIGKVMLLIFNRWGIEEYHDDDYKNNWDGKNMKGIELPVDTYFYVLKFESGSMRKGSVLIKRQ